MDLFGASFAERRLHGNSGGGATGSLPAEHPLFGFGAVSIPLSRAHVIMTLASSKLPQNHKHRGSIETLTQDRQTAVMGELGPRASDIPST